MDTNKTQNRVQAYLSNSVYQAFREYCKKEKLNQSQAMEKILSNFLLQKEKVYIIADNNQDKIKDLESRLSQLEAIIKTKDYMITNTKDYLEKARVNTYSIKLTSKNINKIMK
ncbi:hypothetical protein [Cyanothece sp. BG0011]|uniref:hypothetical protein n=1 Tax=Cyanothece sp. BG0011 TaxID=2082950 RepID=UPI000D1E077C|nr:hypothetical protein [Cyanothece sp. BG0011]